jgi:hypothetical protein
LKLTQFCHSELVSESLLEAETSSAWQLVVIFHSYQFVKFVF